MTSVARGDRHAFEELYKAALPEVQRIALGVVRRQVLAEEVAQEVLLEAWRRADRYNPGVGSVLAWLSMIARRRAIDVVRHEQALHDREQRHATLSSVLTPDDVSDGLLLHDTRAEVAHALTRLTTRQREALVLTFYAEASYAQAAADLGLPLGTFKARIRGGLSQLGRELAA